MDPETAVTWLLVMVLEISVAMAVGFVLGRIWQIRCDLEQERTGDFIPPPIARIPVSCATMAAGRIYYLGHAWNKNIRSPYWKLRPRPAYIRRFPPPWSVEGIGRHDQ